MSIGFPPLELMVKVAFYAHTMDSEEGRILRSTPVDDRRER